MHPPNQMPGKSGMPLNHCTTLYFKHTMGSSLLWPGKLLGEVEVRCAVDPESQGPAPAVEPVDKCGEVGVQAPNALHPHARVPLAGGPHRVCHPGRGCGGGAADPGPLCQSLHRPPGRPRMQGVARLGPFLKDAMQTIRDFYLRESAEE